MEREHGPAEFTKGEAPNSQGVGDTEKGISSSVEMEAICMDVSCLPGGFPPHNSMVQSLCNLGKMLEHYGKVPQVPQM